MAKIISTAAVRLEVSDKGFSAAVKRAVRNAVLAARTDLVVDVDENGLKQKIQNAARSVKEVRVPINVDHSIFTQINKVKSAFLSISKVTLSIGSLAGLIQLIGGLGAAVVQLTGLLGLLPAAGIAGAAAIGALAVGMQGFGDAMKNIGDPAKFNEAIAKLAPNAQTAAKAIQGLSGQWKALQLDVQQRLFEGVGNTISQLATAQLPVLRTGLAGVAGELSRSFNLWGQWAAEAKQVSSLKNIFGDIQQSLFILSPAGRDFAAALTDIAVVGAGFLPQLARSISTAAENFRAFIDQARQTGQLQQWIQTGVTAFSLLGQIIGNVAGSLSAFFQGIGAGGGNFLKILADLTAQMETFLKSVEGQQALQALGTALNTAGTAASQVFGAALQALGPILVALAPFIATLAQTLGQALVTAINVLSPLLLQLATFLSQNASWIAPLIVAFGGLAVVILPLANMINGLAKTFTLVASAARILAPVFTLISTGAKLLASGIGVLVRFLPVLMTGLRALFTLLMTNPFIAIATVIVGLVVLIISNWDTIKTYLQTAWEFIRNLAVTIFGAIAAFFSTVFGAIGAFFTSVWTGITTFLSTVWNGILNVATTVWNAIVNAITAVVSGVVGFFTGIWSAVTGFLSAAWNGILSLASSIWNGVVNTIKSVLSGIGGFFSSVWNGALGIIKGAWNSITSAVSSGVGSVISFVAGLPGKILGALGNLGSLLWNAGKSIITGLLNGIKNAIGGVFDFVGGIAGKIASLKGPLQYDRRLLIPAGEAIMQGLQEGLETNFEPIMKSVSQMGDQLVSAFGDPVFNTGSVSSSGFSLASGANNGGGGVSGTAAVNYTQYNVMQPGTDAKQFANTVLQRGMSSFLSGGSTLPVSKQQVQAGYNNNIVTGVAT